MKNIKKVLCFVLVLALLPLGILLTACGSTTKELSLDTTNAKIYYEVGEEFSSEGLVVTYKENESSNEVTSYTIDSSAFDNSQTGVYAIKVKYNDIEKKYNVSVVNITVDIANVQQVFVVGDEFNCDGLTVKVMADEETILEPTDYTIDSSSYNNQTVGIYSIKVNVYGFEKHYDVEVKTLNSIFEAVNNNKSLIKTVNQNATMYSEEVDEETQLTTIMKYSISFTASRTSNYTESVIEVSVGEAYSAVVTSYQWQEEGEYIKEKEISTTNILGSETSETAYNIYIDSVGEYVSLEELVDEIYGMCLNLDDATDVSYVYSNGYLVVLFTKPADEEEEMEESLVSVTIDLSTYTATSISLSPKTGSSESGSIIVNLSKIATSIPSVPSDENIEWTEASYYPSTEEA